MDTISEKADPSDDEVQEKQQNDSESIRAKEIVSDFVHLLEKSKNLFNGLRSVHLCTDALLGLVPSCIDALLLVATPQMTQLL